MDMTSAKGVEGIPKNKHQIHRRTRKLYQVSTLTEIYEMPNADHGDTHEATARG